MYKYPNSIKEAAKILDKWNKNWAEKIDLASLNMDESGYCILGQLDDYKDYFGMMAELFGLDVNEDNGLYTEDNILGGEAPIANWTKEIKSRLNKVITFKLNSKTYALTIGELRDLRDKIDSLCE